MRKIDLSVSQEHNAIGSRCAIKADHAKAQAALAKAKLLNRKVIYAKPGDDEFSRGLNKSVDLSNMKSTRAAADYLGVSYHAFSRRFVKLKVPFTKIKGRDKFFKISDLDLFREDLLNC